MAAGLGFKDFVTGEVLTAADVDGYLMQGVWVFASAAARDAAVTSPQEGNFAYLKDTNVTTYYTGSAWANLDTTGMTNPMTTTGDTIYSSSGSTPARLGIGTTGQVLTVSGGVPAWATASSGSMTLLSTTNLSGTSTTVSGISGSYKNLYVVINGVTWDTATSRVQLEFNSAATGFYVRRITSTAGDVNAAATLSVNDGNQDWLRTSGENTLFFTVLNYATSNTYKGFNLNGIYVDSTSNFVYTNFYGGLTDESPITSLTIKCGGNNITAGTVQIYGVN